MKSVTVKTTEIKVGMARKNLKYKELASLAGISNTTVSTIMKRGTCSPVNAGRIARVLGVDVTELIQ